MHRRPSRVNTDVCFPMTEAAYKAGASAFFKRPNGKYKHYEESEHPTESSYRFTFYSTAYSTVHARSLAEIPPAGLTLSDMIKAGCWWIDVLSPTDLEMRDFGRIFGIHPLTVEDIETEETREKCELFKEYYFICFRSFDQDHYSPTYLQPVSLYVVVMKEGILSFHFRPTPHPSNVRRRIRQLKDYVTVTPDWINYALIDDITDSFAPLIRTVEFEVDSIDELVLILKESEQTDMLRRIGHCRKKVLGLLRLLGSKADVMKGLIKRCNELRWDVVISNEIVLYLGDIQGMISIEMTQANNQINDILSRLTALGTILVPMNLVTGLWGMNVRVPGQDKDSLGWFVSILMGLLIFAIVGVVVAHRTGIV
ncbi:17782_t:CDS:2 [Dentiscutata erythropus]|uniref:17782_t:CDS:1 n=1 Tax=Dentiscutata erythropus TaxID=1348616 RepID=A0A9N9AWL8_9GLOM|nr:17782_t:CDS:2 [Dentiscutata erythropus]